MCAISVIMDYGRQTWPQVPMTPTPNWTPSTPSPADWEAFKELCEKARKFDELTGQPDCEDPEKAQWMRAVEARLTALEGTP